MKILNPALRDDLDAGREVRLNLGSGQRRLPGFYNVDMVALEGVDVLADLNEPLDGFPDNSVAEIYCRHTMEHVTRFIELLTELHRIVKPGGQLEIIVPHYSNPFGYSDPTHVRFFGLYSFFYFCDTADQPRRKVPNFYSPIRFQVEKVRFSLLKETLFDRLTRAVLHPLINRGIGSLDWFERRLCRFFPVESAHYQLRTVKAVAAPSLAKAA